MQKTIFFILLTTFIQCTSVQKKNIVSCQKMNQKSMDYLYSFQMSGDSTLLDSALIITNKALAGCEDLKLLLSFRKLDILSKKHDYLKALNFIKSLEDPLFKDLPYYNHYLQNRFRAMDFQAKGDLNKRNKYLKIITNNLNQFISSHQETIDSLAQLSNVDNILNNPFHFPLVQYFYCKSILYGYDSTKIELDALQKKKAIQEQIE